MRNASKLVMLAMMPIAFCLAAPAALAAVCSSDSIRTPLPLREGLLAPISPQLVSGPMLLNFQGSPLGVGNDEALSVDRVLARLRQKNCVVDDYADYVPKTEFDNTPYRFNMDQGKKFTSEEFDAWMKSRGVRIATGNKTTPAASETPDQPAAAKTHPDQPATPAAEPAADEPAPAAPVSDD